MLSHFPRKTVLQQCIKSSRCGRVGGIETSFVPLNVTSLCKPMDQGVLETLKKKFSCKLLSELIHAMDEGCNAVEMLKQVNGGISEHWDKIETHTLHWPNIGKFYSQKTTNHKIR